jgi:hypothetical protein
MKQPLCPKCRNWVLVAPDKTTTLVCLECGHKWEAKLVDWLKIKYWLKQNGRKEGG